ncbi:T9SS type A sorting domain-containing protein [Bacteroidota bacterium]
MKMIYLSFLSMLISLIWVGGVMAHVQLDYPTGGETLVAGEKVIIQWHIVVPHNQENWDLYFSPDGGGNWEIIQLDLDVSQLNYHWTIPQIATENAQIRITMDNTGGDYVDISGDFTIHYSPTSVEEGGENPKTFKLLANYPNPFNPTTNIGYELSASNYIELMIYNQTGQEVRLLVNEQQHTNQYQIQWDGRDNAGKQVVSGVYIYRLKIGSFSQSRKMMLLR